MTKILPNGFENGNELQPTMRNSFTCRNYFEWFYQTKPIHVIIHFATTILLKMIVIGIVRSAKHAEIGENGIVTVVINVCSPFHLSIFSRNLNSVLGTYGQSFPCQRCGGDDDDDDEDDDDEDRGKINLLRILLGL